MILECDLELEHHGHHYRLTSQPSTAGRPVLDLRLESMVALLPLARQARNFNRLAAHLPKGLCEIHVWVGKRRLMTLQAPL